MREICGLGVHKWPGDSNFKGIQLLGCGAHGEKWIWDLYTHSHALTDP